MNMLFSNYLAITMLDFDSYMRQLNCKIQFKVNHNILLSNIFNEIPNLIDSTDSVAYVIKNMFLVTSLSHFLKKGIVVVFFFFN